MTHNNRDKQIVAHAALSYVQSGMTLGLGTGSTIHYFLEELKRCVREGLHIQGIPTSKQTEKLAEEYGIPLTDFSEVTKIDVSIDGADEFDPDFQLIKGGGGSLVREKIVAEAADKRIVIVDNTKRVDKLGRFPLPVEVVPFGWQKTASYLESFGCAPVLRKVNQQPFVSDNGNYILDCAFGSIEHPKILHEQLKQLVGVVETGLFINMTDIVLMAKNGVVERQIK
ncbi:ribose-5-phosphate isomerase RpiA [Virgibacillus dokdonensis]|uniref:Ribose-5-phosphate isomerase A n=1 Tax=Virgibacillus dokdonensis TaxID=302167 RepID=A0A2K9IYK9_9BACI|nr:ribose-5-phosphate isomerase RpiA [Virgibacillus dokdonensis]AUJ24812.1 Ribose-5-phosphate isomerase A [Virgibacillus dokdonensis]